VTGVAAGVLGMDTIPLFKKCCG